ncbi:D-tyrosyl-tRNA(Tyr) deacylase [Thioclava sp. SK-1]|uniref:D-aminoacyl-tRNA deacylase n=1 Tax=Thioclava sp. SK-1 TaxID=1889770 RepID=UPI000825737D|nr:D-aminoacyl-tRNA deacylase [Thioclava sp. SK-1]OCX66710.1 D-tyrosyl-tRNA(Tyr) deacylase [Thioclava sp. SK-1]
MRALLQRVTHAKVTVDGSVCGEIDHGLLVLICAMRGDGEQQAEKLAARVAKLRIFEDDLGKMNRSVTDVGGACLVVSQFTLAADTSSGNRPGFSTAAPPEQGKHLYEHFAQALRELSLPVETGIFAADMAVNLTNDGPITIWLDTADRN